MSCLHRSDCYVTLTFAHSRGSATSILKSDEISHWNFLADNQSVVTINPLCCNNFLPFDNLPWRMEEGQARSSAGSGQRPKCIGWCIQDLLLCAAGCCVLFEEKLILEVLCPFRKSLYCALPPLFRMLHSGHRQSRQLEQNNRLGVVWGGVGGSRVSSLDASKSRSETIKLTPDLHYSLWPDMVIMFLVF